MGISGKHILKTFGEYKDIKVRYVPLPRTQVSVRLFSTTDAHLLPASTRYR